MDGNGNPIGGLVFVRRSYGTVGEALIERIAQENGRQVHEWHQFLSYNQFCIRICKEGPDAPLW